MMWICGFTGLFMRKAGRIAMFTWIDPVDYGIWIDIDSRTWDLGISYLILFDCNWCQRCKAIRRWLWNSL